MAQPQEQSRATYQSRMKHAIFLTVLLLCSCAHKPETMAVDGRPGHLKQGASTAVLIGMTRAEVVALYGPPQTVSADAGKEILNYTEELPWWNWKPLRITLVDGKVTQYGQN